MAFREWLGRIGPGALVAAAFVGPGTVTTASVMGAQWGFIFLWTIVFSIFATIVLQEMSARLGLVTQQGLGEALREEFDHPVWDAVMILLVVSAIGIGTAAFQTGNIVGGAAGLTAITGVDEQIWGPIIGVIAGILLWTGRYDILEKIFIGLVAIMGGAFVANAIIVRPDLGALAAGTVIPTIPEGQAFLVAALFGTTIVGYNLFLHASTVQEKWIRTDNLREAQIDTVALVIIGGIITAAIMITAAAVFPEGTQIQDLGEVADQLSPLLGGLALGFFAIGLFAAGFTSAMTAPWAGAYAVSGVLGWERDMKDPKFRAIWIVILGVGVILSGMGWDPVQVIVFAQVANGILLPILAVYLLWAMNDSELLGEHTNKTWHNVLGLIVVVVVIVVAAQTLFDVVPQFLEVLGLG